jgi:two-component system, OmpR family, sensor kinase
VALEVPLAQTYSDRVSAEIRSQAIGQAELLASAAGPLLEPAARQRLQSLVSSSARSTRGRVIAVDARGRVVADSVRPPALGADFRNREEVAQALRGRRVSGERDSASLNERLLVTAVPILRDGRPAGAVRVTQSVAAVTQAKRRVILQLVLVGAVVLIVGIGAGWLIAAQIAQPMRRLEATAQRVAGGDLEARASEEGATEQRSLAASFNEMTARLVRLLEGQRQFVADASHQLRTPLAALRLRLEDARATDAGPEAAEQLDYAMDELDRLSRTIDELLMLSDAGEADRPPEAVDLDTAAAGALERWQPYAHAGGVELTLERGRDGRIVRATPVDVARILDALIENAVRYTRPDTRVTIAVDGSSVEIRDQGPGLAEDELERVFERFHRGRAGAGVTGSGLGLPIARALARRWAGEVTIENGPAGGAVARATLRDFAEP